MTTKIIPTRVLGSSGQKVGCIGLGLMGMSEFYGATNDEESLKVINEAIDNGCNFLDTADMYGCGKNEELVAKVLKTRRNEIFIATKFGSVRDSEGNFKGVSGKPDYVRQCCENSLKRLGVDYIDLYYQHRVDPDTPIEDTIKAMAELVKEGKVKYLGISECNPETLKRALAIHPIAAVQTEYSPWTTDVETNGVLQTCKENNIAFIPYSPLGRGFLTGRYKSPDDFDNKDFRKYSPRFQGDNFKKNYEIVEKIQQFAEKKNATPAQIALAWLLAQGDNIIPIPGTKSSKYLQENLGGAFVHLTPTELAEIRSIIDSIDIQGTRYPEQHMHSVHL